MVKSLTKFQPKSNSVTKFPKTKTSKKGIKIKMSKNQNV